MKLKAITFSQASWERPRWINALGGERRELFVGQKVNHHSSRAISAEVSSLELDRSSRLVLVRFVYADGPHKGQPMRVMTTNESVRPWENADAIALPVGPDSVLYYEDEQPKEPPKGK